MILSIEHKFEETKRYVLLVTESISQVLKHLCTFGSLCHNINNNTGLYIYIPNKNIYTSDVLSQYTN